MNSPEESQVAVTSFFWSGTFHEFPKLAAYWDRLPPIVVKSSEARTKKMQILFVITKETPTESWKEGKRLNFCTLAYHQHCCCRFHTAPWWLPSARWWQSRRQCCPSQTLLWRQGRFPQTQSPRASECSLLYKDMVHSVSKARDDLVIHWMRIKVTILEHRLSIWDGKAVKCQVPLMYWNQIEAKHHP